MERGPGSFYGNNPEIIHAQETAAAEVEAAEKDYEDRLAGKYDYIVITVEPIDGSLAEAQQSSATGTVDLADSTLGAPQNPSDQQQQSQDNNKVKVNVRTTTYEITNQQTP